LVTQLLGSQVTIGDDCYSNLLVPVPIVVMRSSSLFRRVIRQPVYPRCCGLQGRTYYSEHHPDPRPFPDAQERILSAAMCHVPAHGFSLKALAEGARQSGFLEVSVQLLPRAVFDLINYHLVTQRLALKGRVQFPEDSKFGVGQKVRTLTLERLRANKSIIHQWQGVRIPNPSTLSSLC
jgi:ubiquinone biosynthesis protein COQ9